VSLDLFRPGLRLLLHFAAGCLGPLPEYAPLFSVKRLVSFLVREQSFVAFGYWSVVVRFPPMVPHGASLLRGAPPVQLRGRGDVRCLDFLFLAALSPRWMSSSFPNQSACFEDLNSFFPRVPPFFPSLNPALYVPSREGLAPLFPSIPLSLACSWFQAVMSISFLFLRLDLTAFSSPFFARRGTTLFLRPEVWSPWCRTDDIRESPN